MARPPIRALLPGTDPGEPGNSASMFSAPRSLSFRRIVDIPFETCVAALENWQHTCQKGEPHLGNSRLRWPIEHDPGSGTLRLQVRLARGQLRPLLSMRLDVDYCSPSSTALELIPCGRVRPAAAYFRAGHLVLDSLARALPRQVPAADAERSGRLGIARREGRVVENPVRVASV